MYLFPAEGTRLNCNRGPSSGFATLDRRAIFGKYIYYIIFFAINYCFCGRIFDLFIYLTCKFVAGKIHWSSKSRRNSDRNYQINLSWLYQMWYWPYSLTNQVNRILNFSNLNCYLHDSCRIVTADDFKENTSSSQVSREVLLYGFNRVPLAHFPFHPGDVEFAYTFETSVSWLGIRNRRAHCIRYCQWATSPFHLCVIIIVRILSFSKHRWCNFVSVNTIFTNHSRASTNTLRKHIRTYEPIWMVT